MEKELLKFIDDWRAIQKELPTIAAIAGEKNKDELSDINVMQLEQGQLSTGKSITPKYSASYANFKGFETPDLKLTGDFHSGIFVERKGDRLLFDSSDSKASDLERRYSHDIFGISPSNEQLAADEMDEDVLKEIEKRQ